jgi:ATP-dependent helicase/nuclease subunit A
VFQPQTLPGVEPAGMLAGASGEVRALTDEQREAIGRRAESLLLSAAAGSGKTSVLVERFVAAVCDDGVAPGRILAITFTERAAGELRDRVRDRLLELGDRQAARDTEAAFVGTFHGFCARMLRAHPFAAGLDPDFAILDEGLAGRLRELAFQSAVRKLLAAVGATAVDLLAAYGVDRVRSMIEQVYLELRSRGQLLPRLPVPAQDADADELGVEAAAACVLLGDLLVRFGEAYDQLKRERASVDFDDLELLAQELLNEREPVREEWSGRFDLLMVDEFQDTNPRQLAILRALDRGNLFTVGDELQSIYGFRHADVSLFRTRRNELSERGASLSLTRNFRSDEPLLDVVNAVFGERFTDFVTLRAGERGGGGDAGASRALATSVAGPAHGGASPAHTSARDPAVELLLTDIDGWEQRDDLAAAVAAGLPPAPLWRQAEARMLARRVEELVRDGVARPGEVVVLLRASGDLEVFERALQSCGLRTLAAVGAFWGQQQIGDLISYLRALANPLDEEALYGLLASPLGGCSRDCLALLAGEAQGARRGAWETALASLAADGDLAARLAPADRGALTRACDLLARERASAPLHTIAALLERAIAATGYREHVLALEWGERRLANMHKLLRLARRFEAGEGRDLRGFLDHVQYLASGPRIEPDAPVEGIEPDAVRLMTVHGAKGLEFPVVCVADLGRAPSSRMPDLLVDGDRVGLRLMRLDGAVSSPALAYEDLCAARRGREAEEEDRIAYVAMTRARERLLLSGSVRFGRWPVPGPGAAPISWLGPALSQDLPALTAGAGQTHDLALAPGGPAAVRCLFNSPAAPFPPGKPSVGSPDAPAPAPSAPRAATPLPVRQATDAPPPERGAGREKLMALSYSSLSEFERCGYRYYLERVLGLPEDHAAATASVAVGSLEARVRGTIVHRLLEPLDFARGGAPSEEDVAILARELGVRIELHEREELATLLRRALDSGFAARLATTSRRARREYPFAFSLGPDELLVTGVIDILVPEPDGGVLVVDYKSDRIDGEEDLAALVQREYAIQRLVYALAVLRDGAPRVEIVHWFLHRPGQPIGASYTTADKPKLEDRLAELVRRARAHTFAVSKEPHRGLCLTCPGRSGLCSWSDSDTLRERMGA